MKKIFLIVFCCSVFLSSCGEAKKVESGVVTKTGTVTMKSGIEYLFKTDEGIINMASNKVNLDSYLKKKITVTGMYSGSTLYVDEVR